MERSAEVVTGLRGSRLQTLLSGGLVALGGLILLSVGGYVALGMWGESRLDDLIVPEASSTLTIGDLERDLFVPGLALDGGTAAAGPSADVGQLLPIAGIDASGRTNGPDDGGQAAEDFTTSDGLAPPKPGDGFDFYTLRAEASGSTTGSVVGAQFDPVDRDALPFSVGYTPRATRIIIPAIGLDSSIVELSVRWDGPNLQWETADSVVGHHLGSPNPGEQGNAVFSGHINSPFRGEGSIFRRLPEVASILREGRTVDIVLEAEGTRYLYRATSSDVLLPEDVEVFRKVDTPSLTLVTCVPATHYTHRFLVNAVLVGTSSA